MARAVRAGNVWVNNYNIIGPHMPFGGFKHSGHGKDLGKAALEGYTQLKNVYVELGDDLLTMFE